MSVGTVPRCVKAPGDCPHLYSTIFPVPKVIIIRETNYWKLKGGIGY